MRSQPIHLKADSDGDGVGDNGDAYPGLDDAVFTLIHTAAQTAGDAAFSTYVNDNADNYSYSVGGGAITQEAYDAVVAEGCRRGSTSNNDSTSHSRDCVG